MTSFYIFIKKNRFPLLILLLVVFSTVFWWNLFGTDKLVNDAAFYHETAINLASGKGYTQGGIPTMAREPGYSVFITGSYKIFGVRPNIIKIEQIILFYVIVLLTNFLGSKIFNNFVGKISAVLIAIFPIFNIFTGLLLSEILAGFLAMLFLYFFHFAQTTQRYVFFAVSGAALASFVMVKSAFIFLAPLICLVILITRENKVWLPQIKKALVFILFFSIIILPWLGRNYFKFGEISLASRGGLLLYIRAIKTEYSFEEIKKYAVASFGGEYFVRRFMDSNYNFEQEGQGIANVGEFNERGFREGKNYDQIDVELKNKAFEIIKKHPLKFAFYGFIELNNLNSPIIYYDRHFSIFHDNIQSQTIFKVLALFILRTGWWIFNVFVLYTIFRIFKERKKLVYVMALFIFDINLTLFFLQGYPRSLMPILPIYIMFFCYSLYVLYGKTIARLSYLKDGVA